LNTSWRFELNAACQGVTSAREYDAQARLGNGTQPGHTNWCAPVCPLSGSDAVSTNTSTAGPRMIGLRPVDQPCPIQIDETYGIDLLIHTPANCWTCASAGRPQTRPRPCKMSGLIEDGASSHRGRKNRRCWSHQRAAPALPQPQTQPECQRKVICPGFVDPHTHAVYAGDRVNEFVMRIKGRNLHGNHGGRGGIVSSARAVRAASVEQLVAETRPRLDAMLRLGTTTL